MTVPFPQPDEHGTSPSVLPDQRAVHGLLLELQRAGDGNDEAFIERLMARLEAEQLVASPDQRDDRSASPALRPISPLNLAPRPLRRLANAAAWLVIGCAAAALVVVNWRMVTQQRATAQVSRYDRKLWETAGEKLGTHLAEQHPGSRVLILAKPTYLPLADSDPLVSGLLRGMGDAMPDIRVEACPAPATFVSAAGPPGAPSLATRHVQQADSVAAPPLEYWFSAGWLDCVLEVYAKDRDLVITGVGLPPDLEASADWWVPSRPKFAVACGSVYLLRNRLRRGDVVAAVSYKPTESGASPAPAKPYSTPRFEDHFLFVTPGNVEETARRFPSLFRK